MLVLQEHTKYKKFTSAQTLPEVKPKSKTHFHNELLRESAVTKIERSIEKSFIGEEAVSLQSAVISYNII
jgi:hypothetical protein